MDPDFNFTSENISHSTSRKSIQKMGPIFTNCDIQKMNININGIYSRVPNKRTCPFIYF